MAISVEIALLSSTAAIMSAVSPEKATAAGAIEGIEPYRVCRRVNILRDYPDDKIKIYP
ncbi:hypothetical protein I6I50_13740 [Acinetobacter johnsonii]|nr:hypothetical protein [Acinetobacter johnsonii]QQT59751.1 hypothetical protein I6I50_13740 [Acinetobacter johnsonii]